MAAGEDWSFISAQTGVTKLALAKANIRGGYTYSGSTFNKQPADGEMLLLPLVGL